ncbi:hypothetical protein GCM10020256_46530 [Streptomyces thermocoprophilus]
MPRSGAQHRHGQVGVRAEDADEFVAQGVVELDDRGEGLPDDVEVDAVVVGKLAGGLLDAADDGVEGVLPGGRGSRASRAPRTAPR